MTSLKRFSGFFARILRGEDIVLVPQTKERWERQFATGRWNRLQEGQANTAEIARLILEYARTKSGRIRVLDVGCGNGGLARLIASATDYTGIDIAESAIAPARTATPQGTFFVGDAEHPREDIGTFDVLVFNELLYYLDPRTVLPRYRIHANSGAQVYISMVSFWRSWFLWRRIKRVIRLPRSFRVGNGKRNEWDIAIGFFK